MKKNEFIKKTCAYIATLRSNNPAIPLLLDLMTTGICRPATSTRRGITDHSAYVICALKNIGLHQQGTHIDGKDVRFGYWTGNDAPRGGRNGDWIKVKCS